MSYCSFFIRGFDLKTYPAAIDFDDRRFAHHLFTDGCCLGMLYMNFNTYGICIRFQHAFQAVYRRIFHQSHHCWCRKDFQMARAVS